MNRSKVFDNNYDFMRDYSMIMLGENRGRWTALLKNKTTSRVEAFRVPISEEGGLLALEDYHLVSWEELAADYTFVDGTPCKYS